MTWHEEQEILDRLNDVWAWREEAPGRGEPAWVEPVTLIALALLLALAVAGLLHLARCGG